jgi:hypothetical protein
MLNAGAIVAEGTRAFHEQYGFSVYPGLTGMFCVAPI